MATKTGAIHVYCHQSGALVRESKDYSSEHHRVVFVLIFLWSMS